MTLQVCLIGTDGFVLASDTKAVLAGEGETTQGYSTKKIFLNERESAAWCSSGHDICKKFCQELENILSIPLDGGKQRLLDDMSKCLREAVEKTRASYSEDEQKRGVGKVLLVFQREEEAQGVICHFAWMKNPEPHWDIGKSDRFIDKMCSGNTGNSALLFTERYYREAKSETDLVRIAAHTILAGHQVSSEFVEGLEIVAFRSRDSKFHIFDKEELAALHQFSSRLDNLLVEKFTAAI